MTTFIFPKVDPAIDGEDCVHDCETCEIQYPKGFKIDEDEKLYGHVNGFATHMLVATGKTDWVKDVSDEKGSVMEAVRDCRIEPSNGKLMLSASNLPLPSHEPYPPKHRPTTILLLPAFTFIDNVTPATVPQLINNHISPAPTTSMSLDHPDVSPQALQETPFRTRPCPHKYLILMCSQRTRDARCGQSAPLLQREFERHLRPLGLYRDMRDQRPGGVGIYFISHVGGHKFSANIMIYRRADAVGKRREVADVIGNANGEIRDVDEETSTEGEENSVGKEKKAKGWEEEEGAQCIWLARVRPEDCEGIIKYTVLQGKVVKPERQLRGGFDRAKGLTSW
ncbi:MAG: hypothetical protein ASARMPRED_007473 [Alectoria sarmentosa]|nr:MAG: hypothetical protein ASARMPRED_007473 [Alectoria sarmentosa]